VGAATKHTATTAVPDSLPPPKKKRGRPSNADLALRAKLKAEGEATKPTATTNNKVALNTEPAAKRTFIKRDDNRTPLIPIHRPEPTAASASATAAAPGSVPQKRGFPGNAGRARRNAEVLLTAAQAALAKADIDTI